MRGPPLLGAAVAEDGVDQHGDRAWKPGVQGRGEREGDDRAHRSAASTASAARWPLTSAPWMEPVSRWSPQTTRSPTRTGRVAEYGAGWAGSASGTSCRATTSHRRRVDAEQVAGVPAHRRLVGHPVRAEQGRALHEVAPGGRVGRRGAGDDRGVDQRSARVAAGVDVQQVGVRGVAAPTTTW